MGLPGRFIARRALAGLLTLGAAGATLADPQAPSGEAQKWGAHVDFEAKPGTKRSLGETDFFLPVAQDDRTLLFANARGRFASDDSREGNLGLGVRRMLEGGWNVGGYGYFDRLLGQNGNYYSQLTLGAEALGRDWDLRANLYAPQGSRVRELGTTVSEGGATTAAVSGNAILLTTPGATTSASEERALRGYDTELGWRLPLFDAEDSRQLRIYAGEYRFSDDVLKVSGPRLRAELVLAELPGLGSGTQLYIGAETQHDDAHGSQSFLSVRLRISLGGEKERPGPRLTAQERRMTAPVVRDVDIVTETRTVTTVAPAIVEPALPIANGQPLTVLSSSATSGAALPGAVAAAGANSIVLVSGSFSTTGTTTLQSGQTLMGAGTLTVRGASGRTATLTTPVATISGTTIAGSPQLIDLAANSTVTGLNLGVANSAGAGAIGVRASGVTGATITNSTISSSETGGNNADGIAIALGASVTVRNNTVTATSTAGNQASALLVNGASATVVGNSLSASGGASNHLAQLSNANILPGSNGNTAGSGSCNVTAAGSGAVIGFTNAASCGP